MGPAVAGLVLLSALFHATWNTVVKSDVVLFAIDKGDRPEHPQPFLAALADRVDERAAARDDVLDHDHRVPRDDRAFKPAPGTVRLGGLPDREPREGSRRPGAVVADGGR